MDDILNDDEVRQGLKTYSSWPTYPQVYVDGELLGGLDILKEMHASGDLEPILPKKQVTSGAARKVIKVLNIGHRVGPARQSKA